MVKTWTVSDKDEKNFPVDEGDLSRRLDKIAELIPQHPQKEKDNNIKFAKETFTLLKDCGLINADIVDKLSDKRWCDANISLRYAMNPLGGVLRKKGLPVWDSTNLRYYCGFDDLEVPEDIETAKSKPVKGKTTVAVICDDVTYYISNDWYSDDKSRPTKKAFYDFLVVAAKKVCNDYWEQHQLAAAINEIPAETLDSITAEPEPVEVKPIKPLELKDYEKMSEVDIAYRILTDAGKDNYIFYKDLILEVLDKKNKSVQNESVAISEVYTMINMDSRFQHHGEGKWGLVEWNPPEAKRGRGSKKSATSAAAMDNLDSMDSVEK